MKTLLLFTEALYSGSRVPILRGAKECALQHDRQVQVIELARVNVSIPQVLAFWRAEGCLIEGSSHIRPTKELFGETPIVHIDPNDTILADNPPLTVMNDNAQIADYAVKALLRANCEHFAFVGWSRAVNWSAIRLQAFQNTLTSLGKSCHLFLDPWSLEDAVAFTSRLRPWLRELPCPCGIFAANDAVAAVVLDACRAAERAVPDEIAVIGVDDDSEICETTAPTLSSVRPDFRRSGYLATDLLLQRIANPARAPEHLLTPPTGATLRQSTRRLSRRSPKILAALELIRREAANGLKAADVVRTLGVSERLAETRFKAATGHRITEEITETRLAKVLDLLRTPNQSITPIAYLCGWESDVYLKRLFKARFGMTMRAWRNAHLPSASSKGH